ncbi:uncharacterized protein I206_101917 [Kwoniella pini CBS 10737]|uniref:Uncharacterized protein n=1 Tax=Kwoniella pini CBS 10737 TaxID=1296096 RepID=A0A1B9HVB6_9TREE|nr:uncharacterized protein I206_06992 [Kwoniella pini CBS 10737]OCF47214.1 hypothetical protein I206_06992 [Kwoniella pini CBS 10737]
MSPMPNLAFGVVESTLGLSGITPKQPSKVNSFNKNASHLDVNKPLPKDPFEADIKRKGLTLPKTLPIYLRKRWVRMKPEERASIEEEEKEVVNNTLANLNSDKAYREQQVLQLLEQCAIRRDSVESYHTRSSDLPQTSVEEATTPALSNSTSSSLPNSPLLQTPCTIPKGLPSMLYDEEFDMPLLLERLTSGLDPELDELHLYQAMLLSYSGDEDLVVLNDEEGLQRGVRLKIEEDGARKWEVWKEL